MARRRRRPHLPSPPIDGERDSRQIAGTQQRLRRPSEGHAAKRPRTVSAGPVGRARGSTHHDELELGIGETDGLAELDEVLHVAPRRRRPAATLVPEVSPERELAVVGRLHGKSLPDLAMEWMPGEWIDLQTLGSAPLVIYCHPGAEPDCVVLDCQELSVGADAAECRAFAEHGLELAAMSHRVVGVSSQSALGALCLASAEALPHVVLADSLLELAEDLELPTFEVDGACLYERLTMIVRDGRVEKVFYPVPDPATHAAEVAEWLRDGAT